MFNRKNATIYKKKLYIIPKKNSLPKKKEKKNRLEFLYPTYVFRYKRKVEGSYRHRFLFVCSFTIIFTMSKVEVYRARGTTPNKDIMQPRRKAPLEVKEKKINLEGTRNSILK